MNQMTELEVVARAIHEAQYPIALTGAGISVPSGIPDFRSKDSGLWGKHDPMQVCHIDSFMKKPQLFWEWVAGLVKPLMESRPNPAHYALTEMQRMGCLFEIITQNIDCLHEEAGSAVVLPVHGDCGSFFCLNCAYEVVDDTPGFLDKSGHGVWTEILKNLEAGQMPICPNCYEPLLKPNITLFGDMLDSVVLDQAYDALEQADLILVVGTSLEVLPVSMMPGVVVESGGRMILVNKTPTKSDEMASHILLGDAAEILSEIVNMIRGF